MKTRRKVKAPATIRSARGMRIVEQDSPKKNQADIMRQNSIKTEQLRRYYLIGEVYAFKVGNCVSDQKTDGTQQTKYNLIDKLGEKHPYYCDCTCFRTNQVIYLRIKEISNGQLKFESSNIERLNEIFIKGEEYEFEIISYQKENGRYIVCDTQIGKRELG